MSAPRPTPEPVPRGDVLLVLAATAIAALLRFAALGHESIWLDEPGR